MGTKAITPETLREILKLNNLTQGQLGEMVGRSQSAISEYLRYRTAIPSDVSQKISVLLETGVLHCGIENLLNKLRSLEIQRAQCKNECEKDKAAIRNEAKALIEKQNQEIAELKVEQEDNEWKIKDLETDLRNEKLAYQSLLSQLKQERYSAAFWCTILFLALLGCLVLVATSNGVR